MVGGTEARHGRRGRTHRRAGRLAIMIVGRSLSISQRDLARVPANLTITDLMTGEDAANSSDLDPRSFKLLQTLPLEASPWESMKAHLIAPAQTNYRNRVDVFVRTDTQTGRQRPLNLPPTLGSPGKGGKG